MMQYQKGSKAPVDTSSGGPLYVGGGGHKEKRGGKLKEVKSLAETPPTQSKKTRV